MTVVTTATKTFDYKSIDAQGKETKGKVDAPNKLAAVHAVRQQGLIPLSVSESGRGLRREIPIPGLTGRVGLKDVSILSRQFATLTSSGMPLLRSLSILEQQTARPALRKAIEDVRGDIESGVSLSTALGRHPRVFPALMVAMIRAGETGGFLEEALERIAGNLEKDLALRGKIKSALTYPVIVLAFSLLMILAVLIFIVPVFEGMFRQFGGELPVPTRIIVTASHDLAWFGPLATVLIAAGVALLRADLRRSPARRLAFDRLKLRAPIFGKLVQKMAISRFARNLSTLLAVGVPVLQALDVVGATIGNAVMADVMNQLQASIRDGRPMSAPLRRQSSFPPMVAHMVEIGEESGQISQMLGKISDFYDREVDSATESLTASIEPIMVVLMGAIVGGMVICLYLPMFTIYQHIGQ